MLDELITELNYVSAEKNALAEREKKIKDRIIEAVEKEALDQLAKKADPYGVVRIGPVSLTYPKKVKWDQVKLADLYEQIKKGNENPLDYMKVEYDVPETKYKAWPEVIKNEFIGARTVERGNPTLKIDNEVNNA